VLIINNSAGEFTISRKFRTYFDHVTLDVPQTFKVLSNHADDGHQMYFGGSVVGKASTIGIGISPTYPPIFAGDQEVRNVASLKTSVNFEPPSFENAAICK